MGRPVGTNGFVDDREAYLGRPDWRDVPPGQGLQWRLVLSSAFPSAEAAKRAAAQEKSLAIQGADA